MKYGDTVISRDGDESGSVINSGTDRQCFEGCGGTRIAVRWIDGTLTYPCSHGIRTLGENVHQID